MSSSSAIGNSDMPSSEVPKASGSAPTEPKKSARLAEKRKLRSELSPTGIKGGHLAATRPLKATTTLWAKNPAYQQQLQLQQQQQGRVSPPPEPLTDTVQFFMAEEDDILLSNQINISTTPLDKEEGDSSGEEEWLDALETGTFEELVNEEFQDIPTHEANLEPLTSDLVNLDVSQPSPDVVDAVPLVHKVNDKDSQEMIILRAIKSQKRRALAQQKKEIDKKRTMDRLLKKQQAKITRPTPKPRDTRNISTPKITYVIRADMNTVSFPPDCQILNDISKKDDFPRRIPEVIMCGVDNCKNPKKYNCSKTNIPLCSLECYKRNLVNHADSLPPD